jgi:hypothetical protein
MEQPHLTILNPVTDCVTDFAAHLGDIRAQTARRGRRLLTIRSGAASGAVGLMSGSSSA